MIARHWPAYICLICLLMCVCLVLLANNFDIKSDFIVITYLSSGLVLYLSFAHLIESRVTAGRSIPAPMTFLVVALFYFLLAIYFGLAWYFFSSLPLSKVGENTSPQNAFLLSAELLTGGNSALLTSPTLTESGLAVSQRLFSLIQLAFLIGLVIRVLDKKREPAYMPAIFLKTFSGIKNFLLICSS